MISEILEESNARRLADADRFASLDHDLCQLCHAYGADKRSLFISCFYAVHEVVPEAIDLGGVPDEATARRGYYLCICKSCRAALLSLLKMWRDERAARRGIPKDHDGADDGYEADRDIPVRVNGAVVMMTDAEYAAFVAGNV